MGVWGIAMSLQYLPLLALAYLLGSIPSALIASRLSIGMDIRSLGDGNMGAKNVFHSVGRLAGAIVALADIAKGAVAIYVCQVQHAPDKVVLVAGACAVLGHDFPLFAGFRGGQGMAAIIGVFGMLFPIETVLALCALVIVLAVFRNWDLSCAAAFVLLVGLMWLTGQPAIRMLYPIGMLPTMGIRKVMQKLSPRHVVT
jgi:glycerol-3-phosphate acyltransferase PlsY